MSAAGPCSRWPTASVATRAARSPRRPRSSHWPPSTAASSPTPPRRPRPWPAPSPRRTRPSSTRPPATQACGAWAPPSPPPPSPATTSSSPTSATAAPTSSATARSARSPPTTPSSASSSAAAAQAAVHPERSILTRAVGLDPRIPVDTPDPIDLRPGDQVLLCSDGLTEAVPDPQIAELLTANPDGHAACRALIDTANNAGGPDNITLIIIRVE
jgi:Stage II sporulation protein E (SpoIIE)